MQARKEHLSCLEIENPWAVIQSPLAPQDGDQLWQKNKPQTFNQTCHSAAV